MRKLLLASALALLPLEASAQSNPGFYTGMVPTATQWNSYFSAKEDYNGTLHGIAQGTINATPGTYGSATQCAIVTVSAGGLVTAVSQIACAGGGGGGSPGGANYTVQYNATGTFGGVGPGTITTVLHGNTGGAPSYGPVSLTTDVSGALPNANLANPAITIGGVSTALGASITASTILNSIGSTQGDILYSGGTNWTVLGPGSVNACLLSGGSSANPSWGSCSTGSVTTTGSPASGQMTKFSGASTITNAVAGTDYAAPTSGTSLLYGNGAGGFSNATIGSGLTFTGGTLTATGSGGTVTSVGLSLPSFITVSGTPVTGSGTLTGTLASQTANFAFMAPNGSSGTPAFRALVAADLPSLAAGSSGDLQMNNGSGLFAAAHLNDPGTFISSTESIDTETNAIYWEIPNASSTGTTNNLLAKFTGAPSTAVVATTSDTLGIIGIVATGGGTTGNAKIAVSGQANCTFDGATVASDFVVASTTSGGQCHDAGSTDPTGVAVIGQVLSTHGSGGTYAVMLYPPNILAAGTTGNAGLTAHGTLTATDVLCAFSSKAVENCPDQNVVYTDANQTFTAAQRSTPVTLTISTATFTPNFNTGQNFEMTLVHASCPCTLANPSTTLVPGQTGTIKIIQSSTGSDTIGTWGSEYYSPGGTATITLSTAANAYDVLSYTVDNASHINLVGPALNFSH